MYFLLGMGIVHCYVSLPEGILELPPGPQDAVTVTTRIMKHFFRQPGNPNKQTDSFVTMASWGPGFNEEIMPSIEGHLGSGIQSKKMSGPSG